MWKSVVFVALALVVTAQAASVNHAGHRGDSPDCPEDLLQSCAASPLELSFVVDGSASIWPENFTLGLNFIEDFVNMFDISPTAVRVSLVTFGEKAYDKDAIDFDDYNNNQDLRKAISEIKYPSGFMTNTSGGIWHMLHKQMPEAREDVRRVVIVMTDGNSQETQKTKDAAKDARDEGLEIFAIGVGHSVSAEELHNIASDDRHVFEVSSYNMLDGIKDRLAYQACDVPTYPECEMDPVDLSFVIDSSASIGRQNFTVGMQFVKEFVQTFQVSPTSVRVSVVTFGHKVYDNDAFDFDTFTDKQDLLDRVANIRWRHGDATNTGAGIAYMRDNQMTKSRATAAHVCIVITDGKSQEMEITSEEAEKARDAGIMMYAVGVGKLGDQLDEQELLNIAGDPQRVVTAENYAQLNLIKDSLTNITCQGILSSLSAKAAAFRL